METVKVVIELTKREYERIRVAKSVPDMFGIDIIDGMLAIQNGTPLPKGHGRLIDAKDVDNHIIGSVDLRDCPTIIEADKENDNE